MLRLPDHFRQAFSMATATRSRAHQKTGKYEKGLDGSSIEAWVGLSKRGSFRRSSRRLHICVTLSRRSVGQSRYFFLEAKLFPFHLGNFKIARTRTFLFSFNSIRERPVFSAKLLDMGSN